MNTIRPHPNRLLGIAALAGYGVHAAYHVWRGEPEDLLWVCHLAAVLVGIGLIAQSKSLTGTGTLILCLGTPLWLIDLSQGSEFMPTSLGTHALGLALGLWGVRKSGIGRGAWWKAALVTIALIIVSRLSTPAASNVNLAFATPPGMDRYFSRHVTYLTVMIGISCAYFWVVEILFRRIFEPNNSGEIVP